MNKFKKGLKVKDIDLKLPTMYKMYTEYGEYVGMINHNYEKQQNKWLNGITILLETQNGKIIMQNRGNTKLNPNQEDFCSGHVDNNETYMQTAYREAKEELGLEEYEIKNLTKILEPIPLNFNGRKFFIQFFYAKVNSENIKIDNEEVTSYHEEEESIAFNRLREGKTKFPYNTNKEKFEEIIKEFQKIKEKNNMLIGKEEIK